ncbi:flavodoxin family protein, partial [Patescibacteria group bacterium]|nr:flavodoxin family protein [Patescibacteria group bacterium]
RMWKNRLGWHCLLKGRTARVIVLCGNPAFLDWLAFGDFTASLKRSLLEFAGVKTKVTTFGKSETSSDGRREIWKKKVRRLGRKAQ